MDKLSPSEWSKVSQNAHMAGFGELREPDVDRIDYALFVHDGGKPCAYVTIDETEKTIAYMHFGAAFPGTRGTVWAVKCYMMAVNYLKERYEIIHTHTKNYNLPVIKMALAAGFLIIGTKTYHGEVSLTLCWERPA